MPSKPSILCNIKSGAALAAVPYLRETLNWVSAWVFNLMAGDGIEIEARESDHPKIKANIVAGSGISISRSNGQIRISVSEDGDDDGGKGSGGTASGGGSGSGGGGGSGGTNCNNWSGDVGNGDGDSGMDNGGDNCAELNGW